MTEYVDVSTIEAGDKVKPDYRDGGTWFSFKGWHEVTATANGSLVVGSFLLRRADGTAPTYTRIRAHRPAPVPVPTEPGIAFVATVRGVPDVPTFVSDDMFGARYVTARVVEGFIWHGPEHITDVRQVTRLGVEVDRG